MAASFQGFRSLVENSPDAISVIDPHGEILYGSASTTKLLGYQPEELMGRNCFELVHPEDRDRSSRALQDVLSKPPGPYQWYARVRRKDGTYSWVESTVSNLLVEPDVQAIVMQQQDINTRRAQEVEKQRHAEELVSSNLRLEEFAYTAAHDLREPLGAITLYTYMLVQKTKMDASAKQMASFIVDNTTRMSALIDDLLSFASTGMPAPLERVDLQQVMTQASHNLTLAIKESGATVSADTLPVVRSNEIQLVRLLQNLVGNALKYCGQESPEIHVSAESRGTDWVIRVKDNGIGIARRFHDCIFDPFKRLHGRQIPGTGLGLAVCKKIVEGLGGKIWVESGVGQGSTFCFTIVAEAKVALPATHGNDDGCQMRKPVARPRLPHEKAVA